jgi:hypothetical protein
VEDQSNDSISDSPVLRTTLKIVMVFPSGVTYACVAKGGGSILYSKYAAGWQHPTSAQVGLPET